MRRTLGLAWLLAGGAGAGVALVGCFQGPVAGEVTLQLFTPNTNDGAVSFTVKVASPNEVTGATAACDSCDVFFTVVSPTELRGVVLGNVRYGPVVRLAVSDAGPNQAYRTEILEVATRQFAVHPPGGYNLAVQ